MSIKKNIIITGCCGFIGFSLSKKLLNNNKIHIIGLDTLNRINDQGKPVVEQRTRLT